MNLCILFILTTYVWAGGCSWGYSRDGPYTCCTYAGCWFGEEDYNDCWYGGGCAHGRDYCHNRHYQYRTCSCREGYRLSSTTGCTEINECTDGSHGCNQVCINTTPNYRCSCNRGYYMPYGYSYTCRDTDECNGSNMCHTYSTCRNTAGSYTCSCNSGYVGSGTYCHNKNECTQGGHNCPAGATCTDRTPHIHDGQEFICSCSSGYTGNGNNCYNKNECSEGGHNCHVDATCTDRTPHIDGGQKFTCSCMDGYDDPNGDATVCTKALAPCVQTNVDNWCRAFTSGVCSNPDTNVYATLRWGLRYSCFYQHDQYPNQDRTCSYNDKNTYNDVVVDAEIQSIIGQACTAVNPKFGEMVHESHTGSGTQSKSWSISTSCQNIQIYSTTFNTHENDKLRFGGTTFSGAGIEIDHQVSHSQLTAEFTETTTGHFAGFTMKWMCIKTTCPVKWRMEYDGSEWWLKPSDTFGTCVPKDTLIENCGAVQQNSLCSACDPGYFCNNPYVAAITECPSGYWPDITDICIPCVAGTYQDFQGQGECKPCPARFYCPDRSHSTKPCPPGHYCLAGAHSPTICEAGTYEPGYEAESCSTCPSGKYCQTGCINPISCPVGHKCIEGSSTPVQCNATTYQSETNKEFCMTCTEGHYCEAGASVQITCPKGHYCPPAVSIPIFCEIGYHSSSIGAASCTLCPKYHKCPSVRMDNPILCEPGMYQHFEGNSTCLPCAPGYSCINGQGTGCSPGTFTNAFQMSECSKCQKGTYQPDASSTLCIECEVAYHCPTSGLENAILCPNGTFQEDPGKSECHDCPKGNYCINGLKYECSVGQFADIENSSCMDCNPGSFAANTGQSKCEICENGMYQHEFGMTYCNICEAGFFCINGFKESCVPGTFGPATQLSECQFCQPEKYTNKSKQTECEICPVGHTCADIGTADPDRCPLGMYQDQIGKTHCIPCPIGHECPFPDSPIPCVPGYYQNEIGQPTCNECGVGNYCPVPVASKTIICPFGTFAEENNQSECSVCPPGYYTATNGSTLSEDCTLCPFGFYCDGGIKQECMFPDACQPGSVFPVSFVKSASMPTCLEPSSNGTETVKLMEPTVLSYSERIIAEDKLCQFYCYADVNCFAFIHFLRDSDEIICAQYHFVNQIILPPIILEQSIFIEEPPDEISENHNRNFDPWVEL